MNKATWVIFFAIIGTAPSVRAWPPGLGSSSSRFRGSDPALHVLSFGDSVASGFNVTNWFSRVKGGTYADRLGGALNVRFGRQVDVRNVAVAGYATASIAKTVQRNLSAIEIADVVLLEGGGNDLAHQPASAPLCGPQAYAQSIRSILANFSRMAQTVNAYKSARSGVLILGIYYPRVYETKGMECHGPSSAGDNPHLTFVRKLSELNWDLAQMARARGFGFVDAFALMNCERLDASACALQPKESRAAYRDRMLELDRNGKLRDPREFGWVQKDNRHPNSRGHQALANAVFAELF